MQIPQSPTNINDIPAISDEYYENIFNVYNTEDDYYYYNISKKVSFDVSNVDNANVEYVYIDAAMPLTTISYNLYGTIYLWWVVALMNKLNPMIVPAAGSVFMVPTKNYIATILQAIKQV